MSDLTRKIALAAGSLLVALVLAEIGLRVAGVGELRPELSFGVRTSRSFASGGFLTDPHLFWKIALEPNAGYLRAINAVHPDRTVPDKGQRTRVVILGDSCSWLTMPPAPPYSVHLQRHLADEGYEVLNASVPAYTSHQGLAWLRLQLLDLEPDVVVVWFGWNDHWRATGITDAAYARAIAPGRPRLLALLRGKPEVPPLRVPVEHYRTNLRAIVDAVRDRGGRVILVAAPSRFTPESRNELVNNGYLRPSDDLPSLHERYLGVVREFTGEQDVSIFAADRLFDRLGDRASLLHDDGIHPTNEAHAGLGAALALAVRDGEGADGRVTARLAEAARRAVDETAGGE